MNLSEILIRRPVTTTLIVCYQEKKPAEANYQTWLVRLGAMVILTIIAFAGGLLFSRVLTLYLIPVFYTYMEAVFKKLSRLP
jgi:hypothetical protein